MKYCDRKIGKVEVKPRFLILDNTYYLGQGVQLLSFGFLICI